MNFLGAPYPIVKHPLGMLRTQKGIDQVKADLMILLLTEPGERVMLPDFGTPLKKYIFEQSDSVIVDRIKETISTSIKTWEPRIAVSAIDVTNSYQNMKSSLDVNDNLEDIGHAVMIRIKFSDFDNIQQVQELRLEIPLGG